MNGSRGGLCHDGRRSDGQLQMANRAARPRGPRLVHAESGAGRARGGRSSPISPSTVKRRVPSWPPRKVAWKTGRAFPKSCRQAAFSRVCVHSSARPQFDKMACSSLQTCGVGAMSGRAAARILVATGPIREFLATGRNWGYSGRRSRIPSKLRSHAGAQFSLGITERPLAFQVIPHIAIVFRCLQKCLALPDRNTAQFGALGRGLVVTWPGRGENTPKDLNIRLRIVAADEALDVDIVTQAGSSVADIQTEGQSPKVPSEWRSPAIWADVPTPLAMSCGSSTTHRQSLFKSPKSIGHWKRCSRQEHILGWRARWPGSPAPGTNLSATN
jgi:hypothetical protein